MRGLKSRIIEKIQTMDSLTDILQLSKTVQSMVQMETLFKEFSRMLETWIQPLKYMLSRNVTTVKTNISNWILEVPVVGNHPAWIKVERSVVIVVVPTFQSNVLPMAKNVSNTRRRIISQSFVSVQRKSQVVQLATLNILQGKMLIKWKNKVWIWHWYWWV